MIENVSDISVLRIRFHKVSPLGQHKEFRKCFAKSLYLVIHFNFTLFEVPPKLLKSWAPTYI